MSGRAAASILALVSGLPARQRRLRRLAMLQVYCDESDKDGLFVMAGYVATAEKWAEFSDDWDRLLGMRSPHYPRLDEFHMNEMRSSPERRELAEVYYRVIEDHLETAVACVIDTANLRKAVEEVGASQWLKRTDLLRNPYFTAFSSLVGKLASCKSEGVLLEESNDPLEFVFDNSANKTKCLEAWDGFVNHFRRTKAAQQLGDTPQFRNSASTLPLQAADLWAYWVREWISAGADIHRIAELPFPWPARRKFDIFFVRETNESLVRDMRDLILMAQLVRSGVFASSIFAPHPFVLLARTKPSKTNIVGPNTRKR